MSVRFYNTTGWLVGLDFHMFQAAAPPDPLPVPVPLFPHVTVVKLSWGIASEKSKLANVTSDGASMLQRGHALKMTPHVFVPCAVPHPLEALQIGIVMLNAKTTCVMGVASVTGGREELATCLAGWWGLNVDCSSPVDAPLGHVFNGNTVRTTPTVADYVNALISAAIAPIQTLLEYVLPKGSFIVKFLKKYKSIKKKVKLAEQVVKYLLKQIGKTIPMPSDLEKKIDKKREELVRKLLGGH